jgi:hypothetical protein
VCDEQHLLKSEDITTEDNWQTIKHTEHWSKTKVLQNAVVNLMKWAWSYKMHVQTMGAGTHNRTHLAPVSIINPKSPWRTTFLTWPFLLCICCNTTRRHSWGCCCYCCCNWWWTSSRDDNSWLQKPSFKWMIESKCQQVRKCHMTVMNWLNLHGTDWDTGKE